MQSERFGAATVVFFESVTVTVQPIADGGQQLPPSEGLRRSFGTWADGAEELDKYLEWHLESVDFSDPNRPKTCLEVDFPILPINHVSTIEGNAGKKIETGTQLVY